MKLNEETVLTRWMEDGAHLSIMFQAYFYFFSFPCLPDLLTLFASFDFQKLAHA